jgi:uncharacterized protein HemY
MRYPTPRHRTRTKSARQYLMLAEILDKMGRTSEARNARDDATRLKAMATSPRIAAN